MKHYLLVFLVCISMQGFAKEDRRLRDCSLRDRLCAEDQNNKTLVIGLDFDYEPGDAAIQGTLFAVTTLVQ